LNKIQGLWKNPNIINGKDCKLSLFVAPSSAKTTEHKTDVTKPKQSGHAVLDLTDCLHFNCHSKFDVKHNTQRSGLYLADDKVLRLQDIFGLRLPKCKLVTLSACESGLVDITNESDEYIGMPSAFIHAGSSHVVCSLWFLYDVSTMGLMVKFYSLLKENAELSIAEGLWKAQQWFRRGNANLSKLLGDQNVPKSQERIRRALENVHKLGLKHPVYWAGFVCII